jgi:hypothetical protein
VAAQLAAPQEELSSVSKKVYIPPIRKEEGPWASDDEQKAELLGTNIQA